MVFEKKSSLLFFLLIVGKCLSSEICNEIYANVSSNEIYEDNNRYQFSQYGKFDKFYAF